MEAPKFSPSDFVAAINQTFEFAYPFVDIVGEIANFRVSKGKWVYFDLKDESASVKFFGTVYTLPGPLEDGMVVRVSGSPRLSPLYGFSVSFQRVVPVGEGTLKRAADLLRLKLDTEGLFDPARKRTLPYPPATVGLVTSGQSAAYQDFVKVLGERWPGIEIVHADVGVQGDAAVAEVVRAVEQLNQMHAIDVIVVTRGGGSADDLAVFSSEQVVRAVAASRIPTMVAIGHEVDVSLAELAADVRASTPSNAAELLVPRVSDVQQELQYITRTAHQVVAELIKHSESNLAHKRTLADNSLVDVLNREEQYVSRLRAMLAALDPARILQRGYAMVRDSQGRVVRLASAVAPGDLLSIRLADGEIETRVQ